MTLNQHKIENYILIASLKSESVGKLINRIPGSHLLISSLPGSALGTLVESLGKHRNATGVLKVLPGKLDSKRHSRSILYISASHAVSKSILKALPGKLDIKKYSPNILCISASSGCQQAFSKH